MAKAPGIKPLTARGIAAKQLKGRAAMLELVLKTFTCLVCGRKFEEVRIPRTAANDTWYEGLLPCHHGIRYFEPRGKTWQFAVFYKAIPMYDGALDEWETRPWVPFFTNLPVAVEIYGAYPMTNGMERPSDRQKEEIREFNRAIGAGRRAASFFANHFYASYWTSPWNEILNVISKYFRYDHLVVAWMQRKLIESSPVDHNTRQRLVDRIWPDCHAETRAFFISLELGPDATRNEVLSALHPSQGV